MLHPQDNIWKQYSREIQKCNLHFKIHFYKITNIYASLSERDLAKAVGL